MKLNLETKNIFEMKNKKRNIALIAVHHLKISLCAKLFTWLACGSFFPIVLV
jgi:hypothetical protein